MLRVIKRASRMDKFIFYLRIETGMRVKDIAEVIGYTPDRTSCHLRKIYSDIRREIENVGN